MAALVAVLLTQPVFGQTPSVVLTLDKGTYTQFEPVVATVDVTNNGAVPAGWGQPGGSVTRYHSRFDFRLSTPWGLVKMTYGLRFAPRQEMFEYLTDPVTFAPGQTLSYSYNIFFDFPVWFETGEYTLEYLWGGPNGWEVLASQTFQVDAPAGVPGNTVDDLVNAATQIFYRSPWLGSGYEAASLDSSLNSLAHDPTATAAMQEFAKFMWAVFAELDELDQSEIDSRYSAFDAAYPSSVYSGASQDRYPRMSRTRGATPPEDYLDDITLLRLRVFLEGAYQDSGLKDPFRPEGLLPELHPYESTPWLQAWHRTTSYGPGVEWILVTLIDDAANQVATYTDLVGSRGYAHVRFRNLAPGSYYVIVEHRNHIAVASDTLVDLTSGFADHDFTTGSHSGLGGQKELGSHVYAMWAGDGNHDCQVAIADFASWLTDANVDVEQYADSDYSMNARVDPNDYALWLMNSRAAARTRVPEGWLPDYCSANTRSGPGSKAFPKDSGPETLRLRQEITGQNTPAGLSDSLQMSVQVRTTDGSAETVSGATIDLYYNAAEYEYSHATDYAKWVEAGYAVTFDTLQNEHGDFVRVQIHTLSPHTAAVEVLPTWTPFVTLSFKGLAVPFTGHGAAMNLGSLSVGTVFDGVISEFPKIAPEWNDAFRY